MSLATYHRKRKFDQTPEPVGKVKKTSKHRFVVQEHHASRLHFDFRLEMAGVLKSWAVPKGPSLDPRDKRLAVMVEDHPVDYIDFEGQIEEGNYGAGEVKIWDRGQYELVDSGDPLELIEDGKLSFRLKGRKLKGEFALVHLKNRGDDWLLMKKKDEYAKEGWQLETVLKENGSAAKGKRRAARGRSAHARPPRPMTKRIKL